MDIIDTLTLRFAAETVANQARRAETLPESDAIAFVGSPRDSFAVASAPWNTRAAGFMALPPGDAAGSLRAARDFLAANAPAKLFAEMRNAKPDNPLGYLADLNRGADSPARQFCSGLVGDLTDHIAREKDGEVKGRVTASLVVACPDTPTALAFALVCLGRLDGGGAASSGAIVSAIGRALGEVPDAPLGWITVYRQAARVVEGKVAPTEVSFDTP